jgi:hypothetical protein
MNATRRASTLMFVASIALVAGCGGGTAHPAAATNPTTASTSPTTTAVSNSNPTPTTVPATVATKHSHCAAADVALDYHGRANRNGIGFATITIRDPAGRACLLVGPVTVSGTNASGAVVTNTLIYPIGAAIVLSANTGPVAPGSLLRPGMAVALLPLAADYRNDPLNPSLPCGRQRVVPTSWRLAFPNGTRTVSNASPGSAVSALPTCRGALEPAAPVVAESS